MLSKRKKIALLLALRRKRKIAAAIKYLTQPTEPRRWWVHPIFRERKEHGCFNILFKELEKDETKFKEYYRYELI